MAVSTGPNNVGTGDVVHELDHAMPAMSHAQMGTLIDDLITKYNNLVAQYNALLAHLDTANVAGIGNTNAANYSGSAAPVLGSL